MNSGIQELPLASWKRVVLLAVFAALFLVKLAPWEWDNTKVMLWCYVAALPPVFDLAVARLRPWARAVAAASSGLAPGAWRWYRFGITAL